ncbi:MAG: hypothetical protein M1816_006338 [Peltula sp. TS41687]|nr:MAG: hypothetical protein M1816_006338 [Peltula sp. TS41687]
MAQMALSRPQSRPLSSSDSLKTALNDFRDGLTDQEKTQLRALTSCPDVNAVLSFTAEVDRKNAERRSRGVASRLCGVLESVQQYTTIMDTYSQSHADIAALVWGSIKLTILFASNFASFFDKLSEWLLKIRTCCPRYSEYQALFAQSSRLQNALDAYYAVIVRFCAKTIQVTGRTGFAHLKSMWTPFEREFGELERDLQRRNKDVNEEIRLASEQAASEYRTRFRDIFKQKSEKEQAWRLQANERKSKARKQSLLDQLSTHNHVAPLKEYRKKRHGETSMWLSKQSQYQTWLNDTQSRVFWLSGSIGSGKTVLTAAVIDDVLCHEFPANKFINFFFCKDNHAGSLQARTILGSLIRQCLTVDKLSRNVENKLANLFSDFPPAIEELNPLLTAVSNLSKLHCILIDGLDECPKSDRGAVLAALHHLLASSQSSVKIFLSSRDDIDKEILNVFKFCHRQRMSRSDVDQDIALYIEEMMQMKIEQSELIVGDRNLISEVRNALIQGADGMFLWVAFQIQDICEQTCDDDIRKALKVLPRDLGETYKRVLSRVAERGKARIVEKIYRWVAAARRPLCLQELREAISVEPCQKSFRTDRLVNDIDQMIPWCGSLVTLDEEDDLVQFAHHTVKEFLLSHMLEDFHIELSEADYEVGEVCVTYLNFNDFQTQLIKRPNPGLHIEPNAIAAAALSAGHERTASKGLRLLGRLRKPTQRAELDPLRWRSLASESNKADTSEALQLQYSLLSYATEHWLLHTSDFRETARTWNLWKRLILAEDTFAARPWVAHGSVNNKQEIMQYIVDHNHGALVRLLLTSGERFEMSPQDNDDLLTSASQKDRSGTLGESLQLAAAGGHLKIVERLLDTSVSVNPISPSRRGRTPLQAAAESGNLQIVERLLAAGAEVNAKPSESSGRTALQAAAESGNLQIVERLLVAGAEANAKPAPIWGLTALQAAAKSGNLEKVERLLAAGAKVNAEPALRRGLTALQAAAESRNLEIVERLLAAGAEINAKPISYEGFTALQAAAGSGHLEAVEQLLAAGAQVNAEPASSEGLTALQAAARSGHLEVVERLLAAGAEINAKPSPYGGLTALQAAAKSGNLEKVERLLAAGAKVNAEPALRRGLTALQAAAGSDHLEVVERLLAAGAQVNAEPAPEGALTALQAAARSGNLEIVERLLAVGAKVNAEPAPDGGLTALQAAARSGNLEVVERLLAAGAEINAKPTPDGGLTALQAAARSRNLETVERLLAAGAKVNAEPASMRGLTALQAAAESGDLEIVERLKRAGARESKRGSQRTDL